MNKRAFSQLPEIDTRRLDDDRRWLQINGRRSWRERQANTGSPANLTLTVIAAAVIPSLNPASGVRVATAITVVIMVVMVSAMLVSVVMIMVSKRRQRQGKGKTNKSCPDGTVLHE